MNPALQGYLAATEEALAAPDALREVAGELRAVAALIEGNTSLTLTIDDGAVPARSRRAVLDTLLSGKVRPETGRLVHQAVSTVPAAEVTVSFHWMATQIELDAERVPAVFQEAADVLGRLAARNRVAGYAAAIFETVTVADLESIEDDLFRFARVVESNRGLRIALGDRELPVAVRQGVVDDLLGTKVLPATLQLAKYALRGGRARDIVSLLDSLVDDAARARGWRVARIASAAEVSDEQRRTLTEALAQLAGHSVDLHITTDETLLGGVVVHLGDILIDGSTRHRLDELTTHLRASDEAYQALSTPDASPEGRTPTDG